MILLTILCHRFELLLVFVRSLMSLSLYSFYASLINTVTSFRFCLNLVQWVAVLFCFAFLNRRFLFLISRFI